MLKVVVCFVFVLGITVYEATGKSLDLSQSNDGIIYGKEVDITQYPHQVVVLYKGRLHCGGSILSERYVLTAAHCIFSEIENITVRVGSANYAKGGVVHKVSKGISHPQFNVKPLDYDLGIYELSEKIDINGNTTKAVQLAKSDSSLKPNDLVNVTGWGITGDSGGPLIDKETSVQFGVVSSGAADCMQPDVPNVYGYVPAVRDWIQKVAGV